jgi:hypothetical protein
MPVRVVLAQVGLTFAGAVARRVWGALPVPAQGGGGRTS